MAKKSKIPYLFFIFFGVVFSVNAVLIYFAVTSWVGLESTNSYTKSPQHNKVISENMHAKNLGWKFYLSAQKNGEGKILIKAKVTDRFGVDIIGKVSAKLLRPTFSGYDETIILTNKNGYYSSLATLRASGQWDIEITMISNGEVIKARRRFLFN